MGRLLALAQRVGVQRGLRGGSSAWTAIAVGAFGLRQLQKLGRRRAVVLREDLGPGQSILIIHSTEQRG